MSAELNEPSSFGSAVKTVEGETQQETETPSGTIGETLNPETPTGDVQVHSSVVPPGETPK